VFFFGLIWMKMAFCGDPESSSQSAEATFWLDDSGSTNDGMVGGVVSGLAFGMNQNLSTESIQHKILPAFLRQKV
jgi:hypothetical protein